jgi:hypothetical protein
MNFRASSILLPVATLFLGACATQSNRMVVVQSPPTGEVAFTVIPVAHTPDELNFASEVEYLLLPYVIVLERPPFKFMYTDQQQTFSQSASGAVGGGGWAAGNSTGMSVTGRVQITDVIAMYPDSKATHIVTSYASSRRIRIVEKASNALIAVVQLPSYSENNPHALKHRIYSTLVYSKLLQKGFSEKNCEIIETEEATPNGASTIGDCPQGQSVQNGSCYPINPILGRAKK